jgi:signal transduction histidine kinase
VDQLQTYAAHLEHKVGVLNKLAEISLVLNSTLDLDTLLGHLMNAAAEITGSESASVLLWDEQVRELRFAATTSGESGQSLIGQSVPLEGSIAGTIMLQNSPVQVDNVEADPRHYDQVDASHNFHTRSLLGVPMTLRNRIIGVLEAVNKKELPWTDDDRDYLSVLAAQAAVAIESAQQVTALQKANRELSELDKLKNDFISIASHELRTPLAVILGYASLLAEDTEGRTSEQASKVLASGLQLRHIIDDLMNLRHLQQSAAELQREVVSLADVVTDAAHDIAHILEASHHRISLNLPGPDQRVFVDRMRTGMAFTNILNNACRFTPPGGDIAIDWQPHGDEIWVTISDNGIGLAANQLERIFDKFYQVEDHMTRKHGGLGIGLSIARAQLKVHGGRIWASSPGLGKGATFTVALPLAQPAQTN